MWSCLADEQEVVDDHFKQLRSVRYLEDTLKIVSYKLVMEKREQFEFNNAHSCTLDYFTNHERVNIGEFLSIKS